MSDAQPLAYRPNAAIALFNRQGLVFLGRRVGARRQSWQMPQGGIDAGETPLQAALRELGEEVGLDTDRVALLEELQEWLAYDFPGDLQRRLRWRGQRQRWFAFRFLGADNEIQLDRHTPEFTDWRWGTLQEAVEGTIQFKRHVYATVAARFSRWSQPAPE